jgi:hypothetical protein
MLLHSTMERKPRSVAALVTCWSSAARWCNRGVFVVDSLAGPFAVRVVGKHAGAAGVDEGLPGAGKRVNKRSHRGQVIRAGCIDHGIRRARFACQYCAVGELSQDRLDAQFGNPRSLSFGPYQSTHRMASGHHAHGNGTTNKSGGPGDKYIHGRLGSNCI